MQVLSTPHLSFRDKPFADLFNVDLAKSVYVLDCDTSAHDVTSASFPRLTSTEPQCQFSTEPFVSGLLSHTNRVVWVHCGQAALKLNMTFDLEEVDDLAMALIRLAF